MAVDVKALTHWIIYKGYKVRFTERTPTLVTGILTTARAKSPSAMCLKRGRSRCPWQR